ncbi:hypothetical protein FQA39_LY00272 [Lamprigera yunnana]|nr:hypothetical protein FQA39_LY00272 [Lamprigera yunnana]
MFDQVKVQRTTFCDCLISKGDHFMLDRFVIRRQAIIKDQNIDCHNDTTPVHLKKKNHVNDLNFFTNLFIVDKKEPDTADDDDDNIENSDCELFCKADTDVNNYENDRDVEIATNDEETKNSDYYELFYETDNNKKDML